MERTANSPADREAMNPCRRRRTAVLTVRSPSLGWGIDERSTSPFSIAVVVRPLRRPLGRANPIPSLPELSVRSSSCPSWRGGSWCPRKRGVRFNGGRCFILGLDALSSSKGLFHCQFAPVPQSKGSDSLDILSSLECDNCFSGPTRSLIHSTSVMTAPCSTYREQILEKRKEKR